MIVIIEKDQDKHYFIFPLNGYKVCKESYVKFTKIDYNKTLSLI